MKAIFANSLDVMLDSEFREQEHPRAGEGSKGGQFVAKAGGGASGGAAGPEGKGGEAAQAESGGGESSGKGSKSSHLKEYADREQWPEHIKSLVIPPAWINVKVADDPNADLLAIGKDKAGRDQYVYSERFQKSQAALKFARIDSLRKDKPMIEQQLVELSKKPDTRDFADCATLIMKMGIRPGSDADTKAQKKAYGATTLEGKHVVEEGDQIFLRFVGKKGVSLNLAVEDKSLARTLRTRAKKAGPDGKLFGPVRDSSLLDFVHGELDHGGYKTKDFRTLLANDLAERAMKGVPKPKDEKTYKKSVLAVAKQVSSRLGNTPTVALQSYIHPAIFAPWQGYTPGPAKPAKKAAKEASHAAA